MGPTAKVFDVHVKRARDQVGLAGIAEASGTAPDPTVPTWFTLIGDVA